MSVEFGFGTRNVTGSAVTDKITDTDHDRVIYYSTDADCSVTVDGSISGGFRCKAIVHNSAAGMPIFSGGTWQNRYGRYKASGPGAVIDIYAPGDGNVAISGDLGQVSTLYDDLPTSPKQGDTAIVTDADLAVWGAIIAGGASEKVLAVYRSGSWYVFAKMA